MNFLEQRTLATNGDFVHKVQQAVLENALAIAQESKTTRSGVDNQRLQLARQVLQEPSRFAQLFAYGISTFIADGNKDRQIAEAVRSIWNAYAGVNPNLVDEDKVEPAPLVGIARMPEPPAPPAEPVVKTKKNVKTKKKLTWKQILGKE